MSASVRVGGIMRLDGVSPRVYASIRNTFFGVEIRPSARKHGVTDEDLLHAAKRQLVAVRLEDNGGPPRELRIGPSMAGNLLEIVVVLRDDGEESIIHGMKLRPKYLGLLP
ncbi:MAG: hypothetical protein ACRDXX_20100 [Stackebrandtia sp.]